MIAAAASGWVVALALCLATLRLRARLALVACAEHELRGPLTAFGLVLESARRGRPVGGALDAELARARTALADLTAARRGRVAPVAPRRVDLERLVRSSADAWGGRTSWEAGPAVVVADPGRVAQVVGNLLSNAAEHGVGPATVVATRTEGAVTVEVASDRGRGLRIAGEAARMAGGRLTVAPRGERVTAVLELPVEP